MSSSHSLLSSESPTTSSFSSEHEFFPPKTITPATCGRFLSVITWKTAATSIGKGDTSAIPLVSTLFIDDLIWASVATGKTLVVT